MYSPSALVTRACSPRIHDADQHGPGTRIPGSCFSRSADRDRMSGNADRISGIADRVLRNPDRMLSER